MFKLQSKVKFRYPISGIPAGSLGTITNVISRSGSYNVEVTTEDGKKARLTVDDMSELDGIFIEPTADLHFRPKKAGPHHGVVEGASKSSSYNLVQELLGELGKPDLTIKDDSDGVRIIPKPGSRHAILELFSKLRGRGVTAEFTLEPLTPYKKVTSIFIPK